MNAAAEVIYDLVDPNANLIFGAVIDPSLSGQVSLVVRMLQALICHYFSVVTITIGQIGKGIKNML